MQTASEPSALALVLAWLDWKVLATIGVLLLAFCFPAVRRAVGALLRRVRPAPAPAWDPTDTDKVPGVTATMRSAHSPTPDDPINPQ